MNFDPLPYLRRISIKPDADMDSAVYPNNIPAVQTLLERGLDFHPAVTFLVGENGAGKSTILEAIAIAMGFSAEGGDKRLMGAEALESASSLYGSLRVAKSHKAPRDGYFLRAESLFNVATRMDSLGSRDPSLHERSHGEAFLMLINESFKGQGLYLLDEPEAALSPARQMAALRAIHRLALDGSQFIIATHSPILMAYPNASIMSFSENGIEPVAYEDTEHYQLTLGFLSNHKRRVELLLAPED